MQQAYFKTVLLFEEVARTLRDIDCFLSRSGFRILVGRSADEITGFIERESPDLLVIDYESGGLKGDEFCRHLRETSPPARTLPVLIVGPGGQPEIAERCRKAGCDQFVPSPVVPNTLLQAIAACLGIQFRIHARVPAVISVSLGRIVSEFLGYSKDLSVGGILLESSTDFPVDRMLNLRLFLQERERPIVTRASVRRVEPITERAAEEEEQYLLGMKFHKLDPRSAHRLEQYIQSRSEE